MQNVYVEFPPIQSKYNVTEKIKEEKIRLSSLLNTIMSIWRKESIVGICNLTERKIVRFLFSVFLYYAHNISWEYKHDSIAFFCKEKDHIISLLFCTPDKRTFSSKTVATLNRLNKRNGKSA